MRLAKACETTRQRLGAPASSRLTARRAAQTCRQDAGAPSR